jgi:hypothetical protein
LQGRTSVQWLVALEDVTYIDGGLRECRLACGGLNRLVLGVRFLTNGVIMPKRKRRAWTKEHVRELKTLARQKTPAARIAKSLKRTLGATRQKAFSLGVSLDARGVG